MAKKMTLDEFFSKLSLYMEDGDKLVATQDPIDEDEMIYSLYNSTDDVVWEYKTATEEIEAY